ncbi:uncharacterized protein [Ptychodera flava]|uniref:uncharacterized protein n=1 Tax=Ptychodera flava TaxID=63121 RepID=UPI00396A3A5B
MEQLVKVLKSAGHLLEILTAVRTESVSNWDLEALQRAHDWAKYFEQVYFKLHQKPVFVSKLEKHLRLKYQGKHRPDLGSLEVNFDLFRNARKLLLESLLQNPHLCKAICSDVIKLYQQLPPSHDADSGCQQRDETTSEQLLHDAAKYSEGKAMVMVLSKIKDKLSQSCNNHTAGCSLSANDVYLQTEADLLLQHLGKLLQEDVPKQSKEFLLTAKLDNLYSKESGLETIGIMLVTDIEGKSNGGDTDSAINWYLHGSCRNVVDLQ